MSSEANETSKPGADGPEALVAKQAPTEQQESRPGTPRRFAVGQTVCNEKNEKGKLCNGHLKEMRTAGEAAKHLRGEDSLYQCQTCGALYTGPPMGHVRDPSKQQRYVEKDLAAILRAAGGTLPAYDYPTPAWRGAPPPKALPKASKPAAPAAKSAPVAEVSEDSSSAADSHRPAAEAQAATGQASAAPLSPAAATASPAAGAESLSDLSTEASTELTPGAPKDERTPETKQADAPPAAAAAPKAKKAGSHTGFKSGPEFGPQPGESTEDKIARLKRLVEEAKRAAGKL